MSHQPSTVDTIKNNASSAYETVTNSVKPAEQNQDYDPNKDENNFSKDAHGNTFKKGDYKDKLNEAAHGGPKQPEESYVQKGLSSLQKSKVDQGGSETDTSNDGPPHRPDHDVQVEQFLRKQYHSTSGDGMPNPDSK